MLDMGIQYNWRRRKDISFWKSLAVDFAVAIALMSVACSDVVDNTWAEKKYPYSPVTETGQVYQKLLDISSLAARDFAVKILETEPAGDIATVKQMYGLD